ncbi:MAG: hypothetical protein ACRC1Y_02545 [Paraclostridium sp.]
MQTKKGYLVLENIISISTTGIIMTTLCGTLLSALSMYSKINSTIEIQQQGLEIQNHIERELNDNVEIKSIKTVNNQNIIFDEFEEKDIVSIKFKPIDRLESQGLDEIYLNNRTNKVFIKRKNATSGYEIGDYLENLYIEKLKGCNSVNIRLELSKNNQHYNIKFSL